MNFMNKGCGWKRDLPDFRDFKFTLPGVIKAPLPLKVDLREKCPPVYDQGSLGSCTAQSVGSLCEYLSKKNCFSSSFLFLYYVTRDLDGTTSVDSGASLRDTLKAVNKAGICQMALWPYQTTKFAYKPPTEAYTDAEKHQAIEYSSLNQNIRQLKECLHFGFPFVFGFAVYSSFYDTNPVASIPSVNEGMLGGHAVMCVGYDDERQLFIIRNSWGEGFAEKGYFYMPYEYVINPRLSADFWTIKVIEQDA